MTKPSEIPAPDRSARVSLPNVFNFVLFLAFLYLFFFSIELMSTAFKLSGKGLAATILETVGDPIAGMIVGFLATTLVQSSSSTTSIAVSMAAAGTLDLRLAIPVVMGANIGTTFTNTIVSLGHVARRDEFRRAFAASVVHDYFNVAAVAVLLPLEIAFHPIEKLATGMEGLFEGAGGADLTSPLKTAVEWLSDPVAELVPHMVPLLILALIVLFFSLAQMVRIMRNFILGRIQGLLDRYLFRNDITSYAVGAGLTAVVQSSSATTSLIVPLAGAGALSLRQIYPYTLGANLGTTITAILASLATASPVAIIVAFSHLLFNILGTVIFYPLRVLPIWLARKTGDAAARSAGNSALVIGIYIGIHILPVLYLVFRHTR